MSPIACTDKLGVENGDIPDANFEASSNTNAAYKARLNRAIEWSTSSGSSPWIKVDIGYSTSVSGLLTQGGGGNGAGWISKLTVSTFIAANDPEVFIKDENDVDKVIIVKSCLKYRVSRKKGNPV